MFKPIIVLLFILGTFNVSAQNETVLAAMFYGYGAGVAGSPVYEVTDYSSQYISVGGGFSCLIHGVVLGVEFGKDISNKTDSIEDRSMGEASVYLGGIQRVGSGRIQIPITAVLTNHSLNGTGESNDFSSTYVGGRAGVRLFLSNEVYTEAIVTVTSPVYLGYRKVKYDYSGLRASFSISLGMALVSDD